MNKFSLTIILVLSAFCSQAYADQLQFGWGYDPADAAQIDGFRLYRDGTIVDTDAIPKTALTVTVPRQTDKQNHTYHLTAYAGTEESGPSQTAIDVYTYKVNAVGAFTIKVIKE